MLLLRSTTKGAHNMVRSALSKVMWVGRATALALGVAVMLAVVLGLASAALGADGDFFKVGKSNLAASVSKLIKSGAGPALRLEVDSGPPLSVNSAAKVTNLNADKLDNKDWRLEAWHEVGTAGEPQFGDGGEGDCLWSNWDNGGNHNSAAFYKDQFGVVHLKGLVKATDGSTALCDAVEGDLTIFQLPAGYRPARREVHVAISNEQLGRVDIDLDGTVSAGVGTPNTVANAKGWLSLDGITFRPTH